MTAAEAIIFVHVPATTNCRLTFSDAMVQQRVIKFTSHATFLQLLGNTSLYLFLTLDSTSLQILVLALEALLVLCKGAVHHPVKVLFYFFDVLLCSHEPLHKNVELLVESDNLDTCIAQSRIV
jgi:hypothetical protein